MIQETLPIVNNNSAPLHGKRIVILLENKYEDLELWYPKIRLIEAGAEVIIAAPKQQEYKGNYGLPATPDVTFDQLGNLDMLDGIIIPGGFAPDMLRRYENVLQSVQYFNASNKLVAFICHAGWVPISAKILKGKHVTSVGAIKDDLVNAGAIWTDEPTVIDGNVISSRTPADLPTFCNEIINFLAKK